MLRPAVGPAVVPAARLHRALGSMGSEEETRPVIEDDFSGEAGGMLLWLPHFCWLIFGKAARHLLVEGIVI